MINIAGLTPVEDPSYRYKMPRLVPKVEGRGNGIKTVIVNVADIATSLNRDASEITKFFGCELGAQTTMSVEEDRFVVNGAHSSQDLQNLMGKYIEHFVLCKNCRLPETHYKVKGDLISQKCVACGSKDPCDMTHRLTTFIIKQHKKAKSEKSSEPSSSKDKKKKEKKSKDADEDEPPKKDEKKKSKKKKKEEEGGDEVVEDQEGDAESQAIDSAIDQFKSWRNHRESEGPSTVIMSKQMTGAAVLEELRSLQTLSSLRPSDRAIIYLGAVFSPQALAEDMVTQHKDILQLLAPKTSPIQQRHLVAAAEWFCGSRHPELLRMFPLMLKQLYDSDLVDEETFYNWCNDTLRNDFTADESVISDDTLDALRSASKPFIVWLQEADEEGSGSDEEEEEEA